MGIEKMACSSKQDKSISVSTHAILKTDQEL